MHPPSRLNVNDMPTGVSFIELTERDQLRLMPDIPWCLFPLCSCSLVTTSIRTFHAQSTGTRPSYHITSHYITPYQTTPHQASRKWHLGSPSRPMHFCTLAATPCYGPSYGRIPSSDKEDIRPALAAQISRRSHGARKWYRRKVRKGSRRTSSQRTTRHSPLATRDSCLYPKPVAL